MSWLAEDAHTVDRRVGPVLAATLLAVVMIVVTSVFLPGAAAQEPDALGDAQSGREVFANNCSACHGTSATGRGATPSLIGVYDRHTVDEVEAIIRQGRDGMPAFDATLGDAQIDDVLAFLAEGPDAPETGPDAAETGPRTRPHMDRWWDDMMWNGAAGGFMVVWMIFGLLLFVLLVVGIVWLVRQVSSSDGRPTDQPRPSSSGSAREELDRRYARGEIDREEYRAIRDDLEG